MKAPDDVNHGCGSPTSCFGLTSNALPEKKQSRMGNCSQVGVSSLYVPIENHQWFVLRATYNRVDKDIETLKKNVVYVYLSKYYVILYKNVKKRCILESLLPNFVFVYSTQSHFEQLYREENDLRHLLFYRNKTKIIFQLDEQHPLVVVPYYEMLNFIKLTSVESEHIKLVEHEHCHYKSGDKVRIIDGDFAGVVGRVARIAG